MADSVLPTDTRLVELAAQVQKARDKIEKRERGLDATREFLRREPNALRELFEAEEELRAYMQQQRTPQAAKVMPYTLQEKP